MQNTFHKIAIVGLGLMGGSLAAVCRKRFPKAHIVGITRNPKALAFAKSKKWIHEGTDQIKKGVQDADVVILCTPVNVFWAQLKMIERVCKKKVLVMDVGSVKGSVLKEANRKKWKRLSFVGVHPMVGSHERGIEAACPHLYDGGLILLVKDARTCPQSYKQARFFWKRISSRIVELDPIGHDEFMAQISHLPHAVAACLMHVASKPALRFASSGFRDTTRIAASASSVWQPIFHANRRALMKALKRFEAMLKQFKAGLRSGSPQKLIRFLDQAQKSRREI